MLSAPCRRSGNSKAAPVVHGEMYGAVLVGGNAERVLCGCAPVITLESHRNLSEPTEILLEPSVSTLASHHHQMGRAANGSGGGGNFSDHSLGTVSTRRRIWRCYATPGHTVRHKAGRSPSDATRCRPAHARRWSPPCGRRRTADCGRGTPIWYSPGFSVGVGCGARSVSLVTGVAIAEKT